MAKASKDYKAGGAKKWLIIIGILVLIAIIVTVIVLVIPGNTADAVDRLRQSSQTSFLENRSEEEKYDTFGRKLRNSSISYFVTGNEYASVEIVSGSINLILDFYNEYLPLAKDNKTLSKNYKKIKNNLEDAVDHQKEMNEIMDEANALKAGSDTHLKNLWVDFRISFTDYITSMAKAIDALNNCYQGCFPSTLSNNLASSTILNTIDDFLSVITSEFKALTKSNLKEHTQADYNYTTYGKVVYFSAFVENYLYDENDIYSYNFDTSLQEKYKKVNDFYATYSQSNFTNVISSISSSNLEIEFTPGQVDTSGILDAVKAFLNVR